MVQNLKSTTAGGIKPHITNYNHLIDAFIKVRARAGFVNKGLYSLTATYDKGDVVSYDVDGRTSIYVYEPDVEDENDVYVVGTLPTDGNSNWVKWVSDGLDSFEDWKLLENRPDATYEDYKLDFIGKGFRVQGDGQWAEGVSYVNDAHTIDNVSGSDGNTYNCILSHTSSVNNSPPNVTYWSLSAQRGIQGLAGNLDNLQDFVLKESVPFDEPVTPLPVYPSDTQDITRDIVIPSGTTSLIFSATSASNINRSHGFTWFLYYRDQGFSLSDLNKFHPRDPDTINQVEIISDDSRIIYGEVISNDFTIPHIWENGVTKTITGIDSSRPVALYFGNYGGNQQVTITSMTASGERAGVLYNQDIINAEAVFDRKIQTADTGSTYNDAPLVARVATLEGINHAGIIADINEAKDNIITLRGNIETKLEWRGDWNDDNTYDINDVVEHGNSIYILTADDILGDAPTDDSPEWTNIFQYVETGVHYTDSQAKAQAVIAISDSLVEGEPIAEYVKNNAGSGGTEGALVLEDFALETTERLCVVRGEDADFNISLESARLLLNCDANPPTEGVANFGGDLDLTFQIPVIWNGKFRITNGNGSADFGSGTATQISGGNNLQQKWRFDGLIWDFSDTRNRFLSFDFTSMSVFSPIVVFELSFNGELTRGDPAGKAVAPVEAIVEEQLTFELFESIIGSTSESRPRTRYSGHHAYDDVPATPPTTVTFTIPTKGDTVSAELNALEDGDIVKFTGEVNPNQVYVNGFSTATAFTVKQGATTIYHRDNINANGATTTFTGTKGPDLTCEMVFSWNGLNAIMEPGISAFDAVFEGKWYEDMDELIERKISEGIHDLEVETDRLDTLTGQTKETADANTESIVALKKTVNSLGDNTSPILEAIGRGTLTDAPETHTRDEVTTAYTKSIHDNPPSFNQGLLNLTSGSLVLDGVNLVDIKNGTLFANRHEPGTPSSSSTVPEYMHARNELGDPVTIPLTTSSTRTLTENLPPAGTQITLSVEAEINGNDEEDGLFTFNYTPGVTQTHTVVHLGTTVTLNSLVTSTGLQLEVQKSDSNNLAVNGGRLLIRSRWDRVNTIDKVDPTDTPTRLADFHGNAALYVANENNEYVVYYSGGRFETGVAYTSGSNIMTTTPWVITVGSGFVASDHMHDFQASADSGNNWFGLWTLTTHHSQLATIPLGFGFTKSDGTEVNLETALAQAGLGDNTITFSDNANYVGSHPEYGGGLRFETFTLELTGADISVGAKSITVPPGSNIVYQSWSAEVVTANSTASAVRVTPGGSAGESNPQNINLAVEGAVIEHAWGIPRNSHGNVINLGTLTGTIDDTTTLRLSITVSQAVPPGVFPPERTATTTAESGGTPAMSTASPFGADTMFRNFDVMLTSNNSVDISTIIPKGFYVIGATAIIVSSPPNPLGHLSLQLNGLGGDDTNNESNYFYSPEDANSPSNTPFGSRSTSVGAISRTSYDFNPAPREEMTTGTIAVGFGTGGTYRACIHCLEMCPPKLPT